MIKLNFELLTSCKPFFYGEILAGWKGKHNLCKNISYNKIPSTELSILLIDDAKNITSLLEDAILHSYTSGIILLGKSTNVVPSSVITLANTLQKPVLLLDQIKLEELFDKFNELTLLEDNHLLTTIGKELSANWLSYYFENNIEYVFRKLRNFLGQEVSFYTDKKKYGPIDLPTLLEKDFNKLVVVDKHKFAFGQTLKSVTDGIKTSYCYDIHSPTNKIMCSILIGNTQDFGKVEMTILESISPTIITWLNQNQLTQKIHQQYLDQFLFDVLHNNIETESELLELGKLRNIKLNPHTCVVAININSKNTITKDCITFMKHLINDNALDGTNIYITYLNYRMIVILSPKEIHQTIDKTVILPWLQTIRNKILANYPHLELNIGVGRAYHSLLNIFRSFQEAKISLQMIVYGLGKNGIIHYDDIGYVRLLTYIHNDLLDDFSNQYLGILEKYDMENETDLINTLYVYCNNSGDIVKTADHLFIHPNTLRQRLKKIEAILAINLDNYTDLVNLILSLKIIQQSKL